MTAAPAPSDAVSSATPPPSQQMQQWTAAALDAVQWQGARQVSIALLDAGTMATLNERFFGKPRPTNVLSFPAPTALQQTGDPARSDLGDIALCGEVIAEQSRQRQLCAMTHWAHMVVHATLHLTGYDHQTAAEAGQMERLESEILRGLGLSDPWAEDGIPEDISAKDADSAHAPQSE